MKRVCVLVLLLAGLCFWSRPSHDPDLGWHLAGGWYVNQQVSTHGIWPLSELVPHEDFINVFRRNWHDYHWLFQLLAYRLYQSGGYNKLHLMLGLCGLLIALVQLCCVKASGDENRVVPYLFSAASLYLLYDVSSVRPQLVALLGVFLTLYLLRYRRLRFEIPIVLLLAVVCANVHVYWVFIPFLWFVYRVLPRLQGSDEFSPGYSWSGMFLIGGAALISPYGFFGQGPLFQNYAVLWDYLALDPYFKSSITEFQSAFRELSLITLILLAYFAIFIRTVRKDHLRSHAGDVVNFVVGFLLVFRAVKFVGIFAVLSFPYLLEFGTGGVLIALSPQLRKITVVGLSSLAGLLAGVAWLQSPLVENKEIQINTLLPITACREIATQATRETGKGPIVILTHFNFGGWCRWEALQAAPEKDIRVTTDGRTQGLSAELFRKSFDLYNLKEGWAETLVQWNPHFVLADRAHALSHLLFLPSSGWVPIYKDNNFAVFAPARS